MLIAQLHMVNCIDMMEDYQAIYPESLKKKIAQSTLMKEQREVVQLFAFAVFQKAAAPATK